MYLLRWAAWCIALGGGGPFAPWLQKDIDADVKRGPHGCLLRTLRKMGVVTTVKDDWD